MLINKTAHLQTSRHIFSARSGNGHIRGCDSTKKKSIFALTPRGRGASSLILPL